MVSINPKDVLLATLNITIVGMTDDSFARAATSI